MVPNVESSNKGMVWGSVGFTIQYNILVLPVRLLGVKPSDCISNLF